ncbi:MAG TPA: hypothetical protein VK348_02160 [Planctomycetota bacterium]|nr:hypothetical protein [Planctomycetota bacterium]
MAEDKQKDGEPKAEGGKKKVLPPLILIAVGAMLGGGGVVVGLPPKKIEVKVPEVVHKLVDVQHPDELAFTLNPRVENGKSYASLSFYFVYRVRDDHEPAAFEAIKTGWDRAKSNCLLLMRNRTLRELNSENGSRILAQELVEELDHTLFPGKRDDKVAQVTEILWSKWLLQ